jgi:hypothetical protein
MVMVNNRLSLLWYLNITIKYIIYRFNLWFNPPDLTSFFSYTTLLFLERSNFGLYSNRSNRIPAWLLELTPKNSTRPTLTFWNGQHYINESLYAMGPLNKPCEISITLGPLESSSPSPLHARFGLYANTIQRRRQWNSELQRIYKPTIY